MKLLAIETSTEACSAALYLDGIVSEKFEVAPRRHAELILPMCESLLNDAGLTMKDINGLAFGRGPGAFTGVRIAAGVIQGLAWGSDIPVVPVSSLAALAMGTMQAKGCDLVAAAIDARMNEIYWGCYKRHGNDVTLLGEEQVIQASNALLPKGEWFATGSGWLAYANELAKVVGNRVIARDTEAFPHASSIAMLAAQSYTRGDTFAAEQAIPVYLRDNVAKKKA